MKKKNPVLNVVLGLGQKPDDIEHVFDYIKDVPNTFTGKCYIASSESVVYLKQGNKHREDGPAVKNSDATEWWFEGARHRLDGPAVVFQGIKGTYCFINGNPIIEEEYWNHPLVIQYKLNAIVLDTQQL